MKWFITFLLGLFIIGIASAQTNTWIGGNALWNTGTNWSLGIIPTTAHDVVINTSSSILIDVTPPNLRSFTIANNSSVTLTCSGASRTITITNTGTGFSISSGCSLSLVGVNAGGGRSMNISFSTATVNSSISGTLTLNATGGGSSYNATNSNTTVAGSILNNGGTITSTSGNLSFASGGTYIHALNAGAIPTATWNVTSTCNITGITSTAPLNLTQSFGNLTWNCLGHSSLINLNSTLTTINGNFTISNAGQFNGGNSRTQNGLALSSNTDVTLNIAGNFNIEQSSTEASWFILTTGTANVTMNVGGNFNMSRAGSGPVYFDCYVGTTLNTIALNITGNYVQTGGWFDWALAASASGSNFATINLTGNFAHSGTSVLVGSTTDVGTPNGKIIFTGGGTSTFSSATPGNIAYTNFEVAIGKIIDVLSNISLTSQVTPAIWGGQFVVISGATLDLNTFQMVSSTGAAAGSNNAFILNSTAKVITANNNGLQNTTIGSVSTSITTRTYNSGADYEFQGARTGTFVTTPAASTARDFIINNGTGDVQLDQSMNLDRTLNFINGRFNIGVNNLTINSTGAITGNTNARYVITVPTTATNGRLRQNALAVAAKLFPIGTATNYLPVTITPAGTGSDFSINVFRSTTTNGLPTGTPFNPRNMQADAVYWIDRVVGGSDAQIRFDWQTNAIEGSVFTTLPTLPNKIGIWRLVAGTWLLANGALSTNYIADNTSNFVYTNGNLTTFGTAGTGYPYIVANIDILPLRITNLKATKSNNSALLNWNLASIDQVTHFEVQKSKEGRNFTSIATVNATDKISYTYTDVDLNEGTNYYRIKVFDALGEITYSYIVAVGNKLKATVEFYNNPVQSQLLFKHPASANATYKIIDVSGRQVKAGRIPANAVVSQIDLSALAPGQYVLQFFNEFETVSKQFIKQ